VCGAVCRHATRMNVTFLEGGLRGPNFDPELIWTTWSPVRLKAKILNLSVIYYYFPQPVIIVIIQVNSLVLDNCRCNGFPGKLGEFSALTCLSVVNAGLTSLEGFPPLQSLKEVNS